MKNEERIEWNWQLLEKKSESTLVGLSGNESKEWMNGAKCNLINEIWLQNSGLINAGFVWWINGWLIEDIQSSSN